jgi:hypothetical protein
MINDEVFSVNIGNSMGEKLRLKGAMECHPVQSQPDYLSILSQKKK